MRNEITKELLEEIADVNEYMNLSKEELEKLFELHQGYEDLDLEETEFVKLNLSEDGQKLDMVYKCISACDDGTLVSDIFVSLVLKHNHFKFLNITFAGCPAFYGKTFEAYSFYDSYKVK